MSGAADIHWGRRGGLVVPFDAPPACCAVGCDEPARPNRVTCSDACSAALAAARNGDEAGSCGQEALF